MLAFHSSAAVPKYSHYGDWLGVLEGIPSFLPAPFEPYQVSLALTEEISDGTLILHRSLYKHAIVSGQFAAIHHKWTKQVVSLGQGCSYIL